MTDDELIARALELLQRRAAGASAPSITVAQLYEKYVAAQKNHKSWKTIEVRIRPVVAFLGSRDVMSLRVLDWSDYRAQREAQEIPTGKPGRKYGAHTINLELGWFRALLNFGVLQGRIPHNPLAAAKPVRTRSKRSTAPSETDISAVLQGADPLVRVLVLCASDGGMRRGEIGRLRWDWIDRESGVIRLPGWACKSGKARTIAATQRMLDAIDALPRHLRSPYVLTNPETGEHFGTTTLSRWFRLAADAAGLEASPSDKRVVLHDVRRGFASNATRRGVRLEVVSELLGHASLDQTRDYVETVDADVTVARETFEAGILRDLQRRGPQRAGPIPDAVMPSQEKNKSK